jgi:hypothetical protein
MGRRDVFEERCAQRATVENVSPYIYRKPYYRALVQPSHGYERHTLLMTSAQNGYFYTIFQQFPSLQNIRVGICRRESHPSPTTINAFLT